MAENTTTKAATAAKTSTQPEVVSREEIAGSLQAIRTALGQVEQVIRKADAEIIAPTEAAELAIGDLRALWRKVKRLAFNDRSTRTDIDPLLKQLVQIRAQLAKMIDMVAEADVTVQEAETSLNVALEQIAANAALFEQLKSQREATKQRRKEERAAERKSAAERKKAARAELQKRKRVAA